MKNNIDHITTTASNILKMQNNNLSSLIRKSLLMVLFGLLFIGNASASHLVGGDISYEHIGEGIYKIDLRYILNMLLKNVVLYIIVKFIKKMKY